MFAFSLGCTQLQHLCKDHVPTLLRKSLPFGWLNGDKAQWFPGDETRNHPPERWLSSLWDYLREHFVTEDDLSKLENLPLIPLDLSHIPITLTKLTTQSRVVVRRLNNDCLDGVVSDVLKDLGVMIMKEYPIFLRNHHGVLGRFVHPPTVRGVLKAMAASSSIMDKGMHSAILLDFVTTDDKRALRNFITMVPSLDPQEKTLLLCLPLFETLRKDFVSKKQGLLAAPEDEFPVIPRRRDFIDIKEDSSKKLARLLDIRILTPTDFLLEGIFPEVRDLSVHSGENIDRLMAFVIERYQLYAGDIRFEKEMKALPFVSTLGGRVKAVDLFDPRKDLLRGIFADEDVFPVGDRYTNSAVLVVLETLGMKSEDKITAQDLYQSAKKIAEISSISTAERKSEAVMAYLDNNPMKLQETVSQKALGLLLQDIPWVSSLRQKPDGFPPSLRFWGEVEKEKHFFKPTEMKSQEKVNLIGTVKPIAKVNSSSQLAKYFGWDKIPHPSEVAEHLKVVTTCYTQEEKPHYMLVVEDIYSFLLGADDVDVTDALREIQNSNWIWNGDGFSSPNVVLAEKHSMDLSPYIASLPPEMTRYATLFLKFGMQVQCNASVLLRVLGLIKDKYDSGEHQFEPGEVKRDLQLSVDILNEIKPDVADHLPPDLQEKVLIPTYVEDDAYVKLVPVEDCVYCEREWLRPENDDEDLDHLFVHPNVPNKTAELLNVPTLSNCMLDPDELEVGEEFGQEEKLTDRLKRLLEDYKDGFAVPKELIQNADDAGATEVRFLYDERTNEDAMTCLINEGMKECQGPALWVYNDAVFQNEDFENLTKLSGATKAHDTEKIGKFGLGFNAVYNLTDVPMLVSRNYLVVFDPNTFYLGNAIRNKNKPGIKIDTNKNVKKLRSFRSQFKPFNGIFGCNLHLDKDNNSFQGTLFRFPLRTKEQAIRSEIKQLPYDYKQVKELLELFIRGARSLLLFTQNVRRVSIFHLSRESTESLHPVLLFEVTKSLSQNGVMRELSVPTTLPPTTENLSAEDQFFLKQCSFLKASSEIAKCTGHPKNLSTVLLSSALSLDISSTVTEGGRHFFGDVHLPSGVETWLVASSLGSGQAMLFSGQDKSLLPSAGVAVQLIPNDAFLPIPACGSNKTGILFCYLPLPIHSGLPVHVNGAFAVASNRRNLAEKTEDDKACIGVEWNDVLLKDSVCAAYLDLLEDVKSATQAPGSTYQFHSLWPKSCEINTACESLARSFYERLVAENIPLFSDGNRWVGIHDVVCLDPLFRMDTHIGDVAFEVFQMLVDGNEAAIDLPTDVYDSFLNYDLEEEIQSRRYDKNRFFRELFFPRIASVPSQLRDSLVLHALDDKNGTFEGMIKTHACIPASPHGHTLKRPGQLVSPNRDTALLFCHKDGRFPHGTEETFLNPLRLFQLEQLGMLTDDLSWPEVAERAESISILNQESSSAAIARVKNLIDFLGKKLKRGSTLIPPQEVQTRILKARFLPVRKKPQTFPLSWKGSEVGDGNRQVLISPVTGFLSNQIYLVCCTEPIIDASIPPNVEAFLKLDRNQATVKHVMRQLNEAISTTADNAGSEEIRKICTASYRFLQEALENDEIQMNSFLQNTKFILVGNEFVCAKQVAFKLAVDCRPYLYRVPEELARMYSRLMKTAGVREVFGEEDFIRALECISQRCGGRQLDEETLRVSVNLATQLEESLKDSKVPFTTEKKRATIYLPNANRVMKPVSELCIKDCPWISGGTDDQFVNPKIPWPTSLGLGVKTRRAETLRHHAMGISFGQKEKLTNRLKRILSAYPCEKELLKELPQNADDAQATEICFVKDPRSHPKERVFESCWEPLQGPALCVYNNKPFTKADIEGIQNLGEGSKGNDPNKTGQYGVGFNAVYHLTDVPSFMSQGDEIGDVLCVFDPHCQYVPDANPQEPGRMYKETNALKHVFPDVFSCYLEELFPIENATMFRLPLRTQEMAAVSKLSKTPVTLETLDKMMEALKNELFEVLLFVNNVTKITLCDIDESSGQVANSYSVEAVISEEDAVKRREFAGYTKEIGKLAKEGHRLPFTVKVDKCSYVITLRDSVGNEEKWFIVQQFGLEKEMVKSVVNAYHNHDLGMLPRGGVACLLEKKSNTRRVPERKKKAFCFLPLPIETDLPVHINGHFALDHEARRNLWRDETGGYRSDWNNALLQDVIASCYLALLDEVRGFYLLPVTQGGEQGNPRCREEDLNTRIQDYEKLFPSVNIFGDGYWKILVQSVYQGMNDKRMRLLPVVRRASEGAAGTRKAQLTWLPPTGTGKDEAFFNNLETEGSGMRQRTQREISLPEILIQTGFNLVKFSLSVFEALRQSGVHSSCVSPSSVVAFFKSYRNQEPLCKIGAIPVNVSETPFKDDSGVALMFEYCRNLKHFWKNVSGLPLLLTQDNILRAFNHTDRKFLSCYHDILPKSKEMFVHERLRVIIVNDIASREASVFTPFDVNSFARYLHHTLSQSYYGRNDYIKWCPENTKTEPSRQWLFRVWSFLRDVSESVLRSRLSSGSERSESIRATLNPLSDWSILPAIEKVSNGIGSSAPGLDTDNFLVPLKLAESVLDLTNYHMTSRPLVEALGNLGLPELNSGVLCSSTVYMGTSMDPQVLARHVVASPSNPPSLLAALHRRMILKPQSLAGKLDPFGCRRVLQYFSYNVNTLRNIPSSKEILRRLPFYLATHGGLVSLDNRQVCVLPSGIPREEMINLGGEVNVLFLESFEDLSSLFEFLAFDCISSVDVYCKFILKHFKVFSKETREKHLEYIRDYILKSKLTNESDKERLLYLLRMRDVITTKDEILKTASCFHDPRIDVFKTMLPEDKFPPEPFKSKEWLPFMTKIGMIHEVSFDHFKKFAEEVAREGAMQRTVKTDEKSKVLVSHLFSRSQVLNDGLLQAVCGIRFVVSAPVREDLRQLHAQYDEREDGQTPYISFKDAVLSDHAEIVWTTAHLLPHWADPRNRCEMTREAFISSLFSQLNVLSEPTLQLVTTHCLKISHQVGKEISNKVSEEQGSTRRSVMKKIYTFLQEKGSTSNDVKESLENEPCILVEQGRRFVQAKQVVLELYESLEISPYLYRVPPEYGEFHKLFHHLGCSNSVKASHYAMVLEMLHAHCQADKLNPNEIKSSLRAVKGLFEKLQQDPEEEVGLPNLYLPALYPFSSFSSGTPTVALQKSTDLIFDDAPHYHGRLENFIQLFVVDLKKAELHCNSSINYKDYIMRLSSDFRPQLLSCVVQEQFVDSLNSDVLAVQVSVADSLKRQLCSEQFFHGILRLIRHANHENSKLDEAAIARIEGRLRSIEFLGMNKIETKLMYNGVVIPGSEAAVSHFVDKVPVSGRDVWKVYVNAGAEETVSKISLALTQVIAEACEELLRETVMFIPEMLRTDPSDIWSILDDMKVRQDDSYDASRGAVLPQPGNFIPVEDHHLLNEAFEEFTPGEYVGFELDDPSLDQENGDATFIYTIIIEEASSEEDSSLYTKRYKVNVGHEKQPQVAESADLYKFHRVQSSSLGLADHDGSSTQAMDKKSIFGKITEALQMAWRLPEKRRMKIVKRLFLQWHPEKNLGGEAFCKEVFEHLQREMARIQSLEARAGRRSSRVNQRNYYQTFFDVWRTRAKRHHEQRQEYRESYLQKYGSCEASTSHGSRSGLPPSFCKKNPQPGEAKRWFRQAEADLKAVNKDLAADSPSYEWACFKCHQVRSLLVQPFIKKC